MNCDPTPLEKQLMRRLRESFSERTGTLSDEQLLTLVQNGIAASHTISLTEKEDIFRFITLPYVLSPVQQSSSLIKGVAIRILDNKEWSGQKRLNFIYRHLVNRTPTFPEIALSQLLLTQVTQNNK